MKKIIAVLILLSMAVTPAYALNILEKLIYNEVQLESDRVLVNKVTGKVEQILVDNKYVPISTEKGFGGIISDQEMYQARYERAIGK